MAFAIDWITTVADAPRIPRPPSFAPDKGCSYCGTIRQQDGRCISCGAPRMNPRQKRKQEERKCIYDAYNRNPPDIMPVVDYAYNFTPSAPDPSPSYDSSSFDSGGGDFGGGGGGSDF